MRIRQVTPLVAVALAGMLLASGCSTVRNITGGGGETVTMSGTDRIPSAEGTVQVTTTQDQNTKLNIQVKHLALPERVAPGATTYVVWVRPTQGEKTVRNVGALSVDKNLDGQLTTLTTWKSFEVFLTAESSTTVQEPTGPELLKADISR